MKKNFQFIGPLKPEESTLTCNLRDKDGNPVKADTNLIFQIGIENPYSLPILQTNYGQIGEADETLGKITLFTHAGNPATTFIINKTDILEFTKLEITGGVSIPQNEGVGKFVFSFAPGVNLSEYTIIDVAIKDIED